MGKKTHSEANYNAKKTQSITIKQTALKRAETIKKNIQSGEIQCKRNQRKNTKKRKKLNANIITISRNSNKTYSNSNIKIENTRKVQVKTKFTQRVNKSYSKFELNRTDSMKLNLKKNTQKFKKITMKLSEFSKKNHSKGK